MVHQDPSHPARILSDLLGSPDVFGRRGIKGPDRPHVSSSSRPPRARRGFRRRFAGPGDALGVRRRTPAARALDQRSGLRGLSSAGRAAESHSAGHRFDPDRLHQRRIAARTGDGEARRQRQAIPFRDRPGASVQLMSFARLRRDRRRSWKLP